MIFPYLVGDEVLEGNGSPERFVIDFEQPTIIEAQSFKPVFKHVEKHVLPTRQANARKGADSKGKMRSHHRQFLEHWWRLAYGRERDRLRLRFE